MERRDFVEEPCIRPDDQRRTIFDAVFALGFPPNMKGFEYICQALALLESQAEPMFLITKDVYPRIAKINHVTAASVERAIRQCIGSMWELPQSVGHRQKIFCCVRRPSNKIVLSCLYEWIAAGRRQAWCGE